MSVPFVYRPSDTINSMKMFLFVGVWLLELVRPGPRSKLENIDAFWFSWLSPVAVPPTFFVIWCHPFISRSLASLCYLCRIVHGTEKDTIFLSLLLLQFTCDKGKTQW